MKNANSTWLNGMPLKEDLSALLKREVRIANDANCLAVSEATDGAAAGKDVVFAVILGTGCGGGLALGGGVHAGTMESAASGGTIRLPWASGAEVPGPACYCGKFGCLEKWVSGTAVAEEFLAVTGRKLTTKEIVAASRRVIRRPKPRVQRLEDRLARGLAMLINIIDPGLLCVWGWTFAVARIYPKCGGAAESLCVWA